MHLTKNVAENCVMARIMRQGKMYQKNFSKKKYGGWRKATAAAAEWRDEQLKILPPRADTNEGKMTDRNTSGAVGVTLARTKMERGKRAYEYWSWKVNWPDCENRGGLGWSIRTHGIDDAFALAVISREMRTIDRDAIMTRFKRLKGTKKLKRIYEQRQLDLE